MIKPLRWVDGALEILDQTRLPAQEVWLRCATAEDVAQAIERLEIRGAPAIGIAAAFGLALGVREETTEPLEARFERACARLATTRPTAVNLAWALDRGRHAFTAAVAGGAEDAAAALHHLAEDLLAKQTAADEAMAVHGLALFTAGDRVLTHCNTGPLATGGAGTAGGVIAAAAREGRVELVWVGETRPLLQAARLTTWEFERAGIPFRLVTDSSVGALMSRGLVDRVIVGADRIAANGDVANKVGTYPIAVLARRHDVPFYVAAPLSTIDRATLTGADIPIEARDDAEVTTLAGHAIAPAGAPALNWAFDVTPAELVTAIVTEAGVLEPPLGEAIAAALSR
ncbi:MAG: methylthioribose-phosphate isomerase [Solirubrobacteraceae bacterium]|nr:methylthioribose-phosphate isomerase [Solirubrobacteraceae bacterium]